MKRYVLDSYAVIAYFEDEPGADRVAQIFSLKKDPFQTRHFICDPAGVFCEFV